MMRGVPYFFVLISLLGVGRIVAAQADVCSTDKQSPDGEAPSPPVRFWKPNSKAGFQRPKVPNQVPAHEGGHSPQQNSPGPSSLGQQHATTSATSSEAEVEPNANAIPHRMRPTASGLENVDAYVNSLMPNTCQVMSPKPRIPKSGQMSPSRSSQKRPLRRPERSRGKSKRGRPGPSSQPQSSPQNAPPMPRAPVFVGYLGTSSRTAQVYREHEPQIYRGHGLDTHLVRGDLRYLGDGIYLTDDITTAARYANVATEEANMNLDPSMGVAAVLESLASRSICTVFANDGSYFRDNIFKAFLPPSGLAPTAAGIMEASSRNLIHQAEWIRQNHPHQGRMHRMHSPFTLKFTNLLYQCPDQPWAPNIMMIPPPLFPHFSIGSCIDYLPRNPLPDFGEPTLTNPNNHLDYRLKYVEWNIYGRHYD